MPLQNRVTPFGDIIATPERGTMMGNRGGCFHTETQHLKRTHWTSKIWITCVLEFKNRRRALMAPRSYTELFFLDEATALAAGHRPCAECRRADFMSYATLWNTIRQEPGRAYVRDMDPVLHAQRRASAPRSETMTVQPHAQPNGTMLEIDGDACIVWQGDLWRWSFCGYAKDRMPPRGKRQTATLITPVATRDILAVGYRPQLHPSLTATT